MKSFLLLILTWWNRQTWGTWATTWWNGEFVGEDEFGNRYYRTKGGRKSKALGYDKRWSSMPVRECCCATPWRNATPTCGRC